MDLLRASCTPLARLSQASYTPLTRLSHASYNKLLHASYKPGMLRTSSARVTAAPISLAPIFLEGLTLSDCVSPGSVSADSNSCNQSVGSMSSARSTVHTKLWAEDVIAERAVGEEREYREKAQMRDACGEQMLAGREQAQMLAGATLLECPSAVDSSILFDIEEVHVDGGVGAHHLNFQHVNDLDSNGQSESVCGCECGGKRV